MPLVFVYGALMVQLKRPIPTVVHGYEIHFRIPGPTIIGENSYAGLAKSSSEGSRAYGCVEEVTEEQWEKMIHHERGYDVQELPDVYRLDDKHQEAEALLGVMGLVAKPNLRLWPSDRVPSARYSGLLLRGAIRANLPPEVVERYRKMKGQGSHMTLYLSTYSFGSMTLVKFFAKWLGPFRSFILVVLLYLIVIVGIVFGLVRLLNFLT